MKFLLDTNVVAETRKPRPNAGLCRWLESVAEHDLWLSVMVLGEIEQGIERLQRRDPVRAGAIAAWKAQLEHEYADRISPITPEVADAWGRINARGGPFPVADCLMAATAQVHGWTFVTRNVKDVERTGVAILDPFD